MEMVRRAVTVLAMTLMRDRDDVLGDLQRRRHHVPEPAVFGNLIVT